MTYKVTIRYRASNHTTKCELTIDADTPDDALQIANNLLFAGRRNRFPLSVDVQTLRVPSPAVAPQPPAPIILGTKAAARERNLLVASRTAVYFARELLSNPTTTTRTKLTQAIETLRAITNAYPPG